MCRRGRSDDAGVSLIFVMVFVLAVGLVATALLGYSGTAIRSAASFGARQSYSVDAAGAMDVAINNLRRSNYDNPLAACPVDGVSVPGGGGSPLKVRCTPRQNTGVQGDLSIITVSNSPGSALLTLGTDINEPGVSKPSNGVLKIRGQVYINSDASISGSLCPGQNCSQILVEDATATAKTGCSGGKMITTSTTSATYAVKCNSTTSPYWGRDPATLTNADIPIDLANGNPGGAAIAAGYDQPPAGAAALVPGTRYTGCPANYVVDFYPGYYDNAKALNDLTNGGCTRTFWFHPGTYFFDFRDEEVSALNPASRPFDPANANVWTIGDAGSYVIGGDLTVDPNSLSASRKPSLPGACKSPMRYTGANLGVQFVFGGSSQLKLAAGNVELCGQFSASRPPIVVYGAKSGATASQPTTSFTTTDAKASGPGAVTFTPGAGLQASTQLAGPGSGSASAVINRDNRSTTTATWTASGWNTSIPPGSILTQADVVVDHRETNVLQQDGLGLTAGSSRAGAQMVTPDTSAVAVTTPATGYARQQASFRDALVQEVYKNGLTDLKVQLDAVAAKATNGKNAVTTMGVDVDAIVVKLAWKPPSVRSQSLAIAGANCVSQIGGCGVITTSPNNTRIFLQGTAYAPLAKFDMHLTSVSAQVFKAGLIARSLTFDVTASSSFNDPLIELPNENRAGVTTEVDLAVYRCPQALVSGQCGGSSSAPGGDWKLAGVSRVSLTSTLPTPSNGQRAVRVERWQLF